MSLLVNGIGVSRGIAIGKVHLLQRGEPEVFEHLLAEDRIEGEVVRLYAALKTAADQLRDVRTRVPEETGEDVASFIDTHLLMLQDDLLTSATEQLIRTRQCNAEWALAVQREKLAKVFDQMEDPYLRTRLNDIEHVIHRIQRVLLNEDASEDHLGSHLQHHIIVADDLTPADTVIMQHEHIAGFITESGGPLSHTAILARSLEIPAVVGVHEVRRLLREEEEIVIDGASGMVLAGADAKSLRGFKRRQQHDRKLRQQLITLRDKPARTRDGHTISLQANIELSEDIPALRKFGAEGVGLYRTEFLYLDRQQAAGETEQLQAYRRVIRALKGKPLTIRTLDLGADKEIGASPTQASSPNPALGLRAIRRSLRDPDEFLQQLRAILRASAYGPVRLMFPMLTSISELQQVLTLLDQAREQLHELGQKFDPDMPSGAMIEVPAAALSAAAFAARLDFLSIGTNDLIQYTLAIDRIDDEVNYLYDPLHPAVLKLIQLTLRAGKRAKIPVSMCGEMAGDVRYTRLLLGMGLRDFSAPPTLLLEVKKVINESNIADLAKPCRNILRSSDHDRIAALVDSLN